MASKNKRMIFVFVAMVAAQGVAALFASSEPASSPQREYFDDCRGAVVASRADLDELTRALTFDLETFYSYEAVLSNAINSCCSMYDDVNPWPMLNWYEKYIMHLLKHPSAADSENSQAKKKVADTITIFNSMQQSADAGRAPLDYTEHVPELIRYYCALSRRIDSFAGSTGGTGES